jgi:hypothetical protein
VRTFAASPRCSRLRGTLLSGVALLGAADVAQLMITSPGLMASSPVRAGGSALGLVLFLLLAGLGAVGALRPGGRALRRGLATLLVAGSVALVLVHLAAHAGGLRPASMALLAVLGLVLA